MIKATAGGGGKGMVLFGKAENLRDLSSAVQEATAAFGNGGMYMAYCKEPRHIENSNCWRPIWQCMSPFRKRLYCSEKPKLTEGNSSHS